MPDVREQILAHLLTIAEGVPSAKMVARNRGSISEGARPAIIILDADEAVEEEELSGRTRPANSPQMVVMTPEIFVMVSKRAADIGAELNTMRRQIVRRILTDAALRNLLGPNGEVRYAGCGTALATGRSMEGEMALSFAFRYILRPNDLED